MDKILHAEPEAIVRFNHNIPAELERIIRKCLEKDQTLRYQHASDVCADLKRLKRDTDSGKAAVNQAEVSTAKQKGKMARPGYRHCPNTDCAGCSFRPLASSPGKRDNGNPAGSYSPDELSWVGSFFQFFP